MPPVLSQVPQPAEGLYVPEPPSRPYTGERRADERGFADPTLILSSTPELSRWPVRDPSQGRMRRLLPSPPPQKSAARPTRHGPHGCFMVCSVATGPLVVAFGHL